MPEVLSVTWGSRFSFSFPSNDRDRTLQGRCPKADVHSENLLLPAAWFAGGQVSAPGHSRLLGHLSTAQGRGLSPHRQQQTLDPPLGTRPSSRAAPVDRGDRAPSTGRASRWPPPPRRPARWARAHRRVPGASPFLLCFPPPSLLPRWRREEDETADFPPTMLRKILKLLLNALRCVYFLTFF